MILAKSISHALSGEKMSESVNETLYFDHENETSAWQEHLDDTSDQCDLIKLIRILRQVVEQQLWLSRWDSAFTSKAYVKTLLVLTGVSYGMNAFISKAYVRTVFVFSGFSHVLSLLVYEARVRFWCPVPCGPF